jgi:outer membrane protein OmpA-like peptidoglycan-associated protein
MKDEDKKFFILVLGVLAAIILVIGWWFTAGGVDVSAPLVTSSTTPTESDSDDADAHSHAAESEGESGEVDEAAALPDDAESSEDETDPSDAASAEDASDENTEEERASSLPPTVFDAIAADPNLSVISGLLRDEGLDQVLATGGPFTAFAPSDDAVSEAASSDTTVTVLEAARSSVLTYHLVPGTYTVDELTDIARGSRSTELITVQGEPISLSLDGTSVVINGNTFIGSEAQDSGNGLVHTLDNVLVPPVAALNTLVALEPILFASGSADIEPQSFATLDRFVEVLGSSLTSVAIEGHTDSSGDPILNQNLSQSRARSVLNYLVANGVEEARLSAFGFGSSTPVADNNTEDGRALNRRIEFAVN